MFEHSFQLGICLEYAARFEAVDQVKWKSIHFRYGEGCFGGLPESPEEALQQRMEPDLDVLAMGAG